MKPKEESLDHVLNLPWKIDGEYIADRKDIPVFRVMGSAPYNTVWMRKAVSAVNEYVALHHCERKLHDAELAIEFILANVTLDAGQRKHLRATAKDATEALIQLRAIRIANAL